MPDIVLTTLNARYAHAAFGLRYLMANLPPALRDRACILEFDVAQRPVDVLEVILARGPRIVGVGVYIWNVTQATQLVAELKRVRPDVTVVLGGPEVSHETDRQEIVSLADYVVTGEADLTFAYLCEKLLAGRRPLNKVIPADLPRFASHEAPGKQSRGLDHPGGARDAAVLHLPYDLYTDEDLARRVVYVEASRGCPFKCEFCLSSLDVPVRTVPLDDFLAAMRRLLERGLRRFKFVDRTFNLNLNVTRPILEFFLARYEPGLFLHFEMIPDRLPEALRETIARFPAGALQFEVGIQTFNDDVSQRISRRQDVARVEDNLRFLRERTGVHVHADLIVGLPGEDLDSFADGFDRLVALRPQEIQVGMLKRLRGTPVVRHDAEWGMVYSPHPPYEVLATKTIDFPTMQRLRRFSRYWDLIANSGNFVETTPIVWQARSLDRADLAKGTGDGEAPAGPRPSVGATRANGSAGASPSRDTEGSPFRSFLRLADWMHGETGRQHGIALQHLAELLFRFLVDVRGLGARDVAAVIWRDYQRGGRSDRPAFLRDLVPPADTRVTRPPGRTPAAPARQARHLGAPLPSDPSS